MADPALPDSLPPPPAYASAAAADRHRGALIDAGFEEAPLAALLGLPDLSALRLHTLPVLRSRARGDGALAVLARLFLLRDPVPAGLASAALGVVPLADWISAGLLLAGGDSDAVRAAVQLVPYSAPGRTLFIASDHRFADPTPDHVMGLSATTRKLAAFTVRRPVARALDLGAGAGLQALLCAAHADQVVATDINPRAVAMAASNALLNGLRNVELREGDLFAPVARERFDLIVSNPPFVLAPIQEGPRLLYRDGGLAGDALCRQVVAQAAAHLSEGGLCQLLVNWEIGAGQDPQDRIAEWFRDCGCDAWVLVGQIVDTAAYAAGWISQTERDDAGLRAAHHAAWMTDFARREVAAVGYGLVTLRRRAAAPGAHWLRYEDAPAEVGPCGDALWRGILLQDYLQGPGADDAALLQARLREAPEMRVQRVFRPVPAGFAPELTETYLNSGLCYRAEVGPPVYTLLTQCRGERTLGDLLQEMATTLRLPLDAIVIPCLPVVRSLLTQGLLLPEGID